MTKSLIFITVLVKNLVLSTTPTCTPPADNDNTWKYFAGTDTQGQNPYGVWYYLSEQKADIDSAAEFCNSFNLDQTGQVLPNATANLGRIFTQQENDFIVDNFLDKGNHLSFIWTAGFYETKEFNDWTWLDLVDPVNRNTQVIYHNWDVYKDEPNNSTNKIWIAINDDDVHGTLGQWKAEVPSYLYRFLCEKRCPIEISKNETFFDFHDSTGKQSKRYGDVTEFHEMIEKLPVNYNIKLNATYRQGGYYNDMLLFKLGPVEYLCKNGQITKTNREQFPYIFINYYGEIYIDFYFDDDLAFSVSYFDDSLTSTFQNFYKGDRIELSIDMEQNYFVISYRIIWGSYSLASRSPGNVLMLNQVKRSFDCSDGKSSDSERYCKSHGPGCHNCKNFNSKLTNIEYQVPVSVFYPVKDYVSEKCNENLDQYTYNGYVTDLEISAA